MSYYALSDLNRLSYTQMRVYDPLILIARRLPEPVVRVLVFGLIAGIFVISAFVIFVIVLIERGVRLRWRRLLGR